MFGGFGFGWMLGSGDVLTCLCIGFFGAEYLSGFGLADICWSDCLDDGFGLNAASGLFGWLFGLQGLDGLMNLRV